MRRAATWLVVRDSAARATRVNSLQLPCRKRARQFSTAPTTALIEQFECCPDAGWTVVAGGKRLSAAAPSVVSAAAPSVAPDGIESAIAEAIVGLDVFDQEAIDDALTAAVAEHEPATALRISSAVSMVSCSVAAAVKGVELYQYVKEHALRQVKLAEPRKPEWQSQLAERIQDEMDAGTYILPIPYMPVLSGGPRADNRLPVLDIFACPTGAVTFAEAHELCAEVMHHLALDLEDIHGQPPQTTAIGSYVPPSEDTLEALTLAFTAIHQADVTSGNTGDILDKVCLTPSTPSSLLLYRPFMCQLGHELPTLVLRSSLRCTRLRTMGCSPAPTTMICTTWTTNGTSRQRSRESSSATSTSSSLKSSRSSVCQ